MLLLGFAFNALDTWMLQKMGQKIIYRMRDIVQFIYRGEYDYYDSQAENRIEVITVKKPGQIMLEPWSLK